MESLFVECLSCGCTRVVHRTVFRHFDAPEYLRCGYLGWAPVQTLTESERRGLRTRPVERRRLSAVA